MPFEKKKDSKSGRYWIEQNENSTFHREEMCIVLLFLVCYCHTYFLLFDYFHLYQLFDLIQNTLTTPSKIYTQFAPDNLHVDPVYQAS